MAKGLFFFSSFLIIGMLLLAGISTNLSTNNAEDLANNLERIAPLSENSAKDEILDLTYPPENSDLSEMEIIGMLNLVTIDPEYSHAEIEHPDSYQVVRDCLKSKGQYAAFQIEKNKRFLRVCLIDSVTIGFQIVDIVGKQVKEKTCYIKENIHDLKQLFEYVRKMGYPRFTGPL